MDSFVKFYGTRKPQDAAGVFFQMGEVYEKDKKTDELAKHLDNYLKKWGAQGGPDRQVLAHFRLGEMAWKASCPKASEDGACLEVKRVAATGRQKVLYDLNKKRKKGKKIKEPKRTQCGPPTSSKITVFDRNKGQAAKAQEHFQTVLKIWNKGAAASKITGKDVEARAGLAAYAVAGVGLPPGGDGVRELPPHQVPRGPRLPAAEPVRHQEEGRGEEEEGRGVGEEVHQPTSTRRRRRWAGPRDQYLEVFKMKQAQWAIASSARIGQLYADFVGQLYTAEIPKDLKVQDEWGNRPQEIFCDALVDKAEPIEAQGGRGLRHLPQGRHRLLLVQRVVAALREGAEPDEAVRVPAVLGGQARGRLRLDDDVAVAGRPGAERIDVGRRAAQAAQSGDK